MPETALRIFMYFDSAIALIDCNNFFVSCERVFDPSLRERPVVVLSNNDGCIISRSDEVKKMGVKMAQPLFQVKSLLEANNVAILSSNLEIYCEISRRVMNVVKKDVGAQAVEVYSIDEAFLDLGTPDKTVDVGRHIKQKIWEATGIPVSVGIAKTKTLAKLVNHIAKKSEKTGGVLDLYDSPYLDRALRQTPVGEIWGVGSKTARKLTVQGVLTAYDLKNCDPDGVRKKLSVVGGRTVLELRGVKCYPFEITLDDKKSIAHTRSFGKPICDYASLKNAVLYFATRATERMRRDGLAAKSVTVFARTNRFKENYMADATTFNSIYHSDIANEINRWALSCLDRIFKQGLEYKKAGVVLGNLIKAKALPGRLFGNEQFERWHNLAEVMDGLNYRYGRDTVKLAATGDLGFWRSSHQFENKKAVMPEISPRMDSNTSEFRRFI